MEYHDEAPIIDVDDGGADNEGVGGHGYLLAPEAGLQSQVVSDVSLGSHPGPPEFQNLRLFHYGMGNSYLKLIPLIILLTMGCNGVSSL